MGRPQFFSPEEIARRNDPSASPNTPILSPQTASNAYVLPPYHRNSLQTQPSMQQNSASNMGNGSGRAGVAPRFPLEFDAAPDSRDELLDFADSDEYNDNYEELRPFLRREIASSDEGFSPAGHHGASPWDLRPTAAPLESIPTSFSRLGSLGSSGNPATPRTPISPWEALSQTQAHLAASYGRRPSSRQEPMEYRSVLTGARLRNGMPYPPHPAPEQPRADSPPTQGGQHSISFLSVGDPQPRFDAPNRRPNGEVLIPWDVLVHYRELGGFIRGVRLNEDESWMVWLQGPQLEQSLEDLGYNQLTSYFEDLNAQCVRVSVQPARDPDYIASLSRGGLGPSFGDATFLHNLTARAQSIPSPELPEAEAHTFLSNSRSNSVSADISDLEGPMVQHIEDIRSHHSPRHYELCETYGHILWQWSLGVYYQVSYFLRVPSVQMERLPALNSVFWDIGRRWGSHTATETTIAVRSITNFLQQRSANLGPFYQSLEEISSLREFAEILLREGTEEERMLWAPLVLLHTGKDVENILLQTAESRNDTPSENGTSNENDAGKEDNPNEISLPDRTRRQMNDAERAVLL